MTSMSAPRRVGRKRGGGTLAGVVESRTFEGWPGVMVALYLIAMVQSLRMHLRRPPRNHRDRLDSEEEEH
jgi:hypothetical protein